MTVVLSSLFTWVFNIIQGNFTYKNKNIHYHLLQSYQGFKKINKYSSFRIKLWSMWNKARIPKEKHILIYDCHNKNLYEFLYLNWVPESGTNVESAFKKYIVIVQHSLNRWRYLLEKGFRITLKKDFSLIETKYFLLIIQITF